jgi:rubrerythrin
MTLIENFKDRHGCCECGGLEEGEYDNVCPLCLKEYEDEDI